MKRRILIAFVSLVSSLGAILPAYAVARGSEQLSPKQDLSISVPAVSLSSFQAVDPWKWSGGFFNEQCTDWKPVIYPPGLKQANIVIEQQVCTKDRERYRLETSGGRQVKHVQLLRFTDVYTRVVTTVGPIVYHSPRRRVPGLSGPGEVVRNTIIGQARPAPTSCAYSWTRNLGYGSRGNDVKELQRRLNKAIGAGLAVDGIIGPKTKQAIINFQRAKGLDPDGIAGPKTQAVLNKVCP